MLALRLPGIFLTIKLLSAKLSPRFMAYCLPRNPVESVSEKRLFRSLVSVIAFPGSCSRSSPSLFPLNIVQNPDKLLHVFLDSL